MLMETIYHLIINMFKGDEDFSYLNRNNQGVDGPTVDGEEGV